MLQATSREQTVELLDLKYLLAGAEALNLTAAASALGVTVSTLSRRIKGLENELGVSMFERHRGGVRLTFAGTRFVGHARNILIESNLAIQTARNMGAGSEGKLRLGIVASISGGFVRHLLRAWIDAHPRVHLDLVEAGPSEHLNALVDRVLDLAILTGMPAATGCDSAQLWDEQILVALPATHRLASGAAIDWPLLHRERFIVSREPPGPEIHDYVVRNLSDLGRRPRVDYMEVAREGLMSSVGLGLGISLVCSSEAAVAYPDVVVRPLSGARLPFSVIWRAEHDNPAMRRFISLARTMSARHQRDTGPSQFAKHLSG